MLMQSVVSGAGNVKRNTWNLLDEKVVAPHVPTFLYYLEELGFWIVELGTPKELALTWQIGFLRCYQASGKFLQGDIFHFGKAKL